MPGQSPWKIVRDADVASAIFQAAQYEHRDHARFSKMVGLVRFELTTSCTPCKRATRLRYSPMNHRKGEEAPCSDPRQVIIFDEWKVWSRPPPKVPASESVSGPDLEISLKSPRLFNVIKGDIDHELPRAML